jgi:hypothetical protein
MQTTGIRRPGSLSTSLSKFPDAFCRRERIFSNWSAKTITLSRSSAKTELPSRSSTQFLECAMAEAAITLANRGGTQPQAIVAWFFVGETEGHEFLYPKQEQQELAHATQKTFASGD